MHRVSAFMIAIAPWLASCATTPPPSPAAPREGQPANAATAPATPPARPRCGLRGVEAELVREVPGATRLTADADAIFWTNDLDVWSMPLAGGEPRKITSGEPKKPIIKLRVAGDDLYVLQDAPSDARRTGRVAVVARGGGELRTVGERGDVEDFDVAGGWVVYTTSSFSEDGAMSTTLWKAKPDGGPPTDLFNLFYGTSHVVTDGTSAFVGLTMPGMHRVALRNGAAVELVEGPIGQPTDEPWHSHFAVDGDALYVPFGHINLHGGTLHRVGKEPGTQPAPMAKMFPPLDGKGGWPKGDLTQTATHLYWASTPEGRVLRLAKDGSCPIEEIATERAQPDFATPAGPYVVWLDLGASPRAILRARIAP